MVLSTKIWIITKTMSYFVDYGYYCPIEPLIYLYGWVLVEICCFVSPITQIRCLCHHKVIIRYITTEIWRITPIFFSHVIEYGYHFPIYFWYMYIGEYWFRYDHLYFQLLIFSVLVIIRSSYSSRSVVLAT